jgi:hypothetical protein
LGWLVSNIGSGNAIFITGDESAIELTFLNGQASFMFIAAGATIKRITIFIPDR